jgi:CpeT protein
MRTPGTVRSSGGSHAPVESARNDLDLVAAWMSGSFSSQGKAEADTNCLGIRLEMIPIWTHRTDGYWLYVEQAVPSHKDRPYRQRVYHLTAKDRAIRSEVYGLPDPLRFAGAWKAKHPLPALSPDSLLLRRGCAVILTGVSDRAFDQEDNQVWGAHMGGYVFRKIKRRCCRI